MRCNTSSVRQVIPPDSFGQELMGSEIQKRLNDRVHSI